MKTIAIFLPNWIGDVVMATPAIRATREHFPDAHLIAVSKPYVADTLAGAPWFDSVIFSDKAKPWQTVRALRRAKAEAAVLFPNSFRSAALARLGGCHTVVGFARYFRDVLLSKRLYPLRDDHGRPKPAPIITDYNRIVQLLGVPEPGHRMELFTTPADEQAAEATWEKLGLSRFSRVVGLNPGAAFGAAKHWPHFAALSRRLAASPGVGVVVLCGPTEREMAARIVTESASASVVSLADSPLSLGLTKAMVKRLALLVTTDSGPRHFAAAFDVPVVSLFGPTHIAWTETWFPKAIHLRIEVDCGPCQQRVCPLGHHRCMNDLTANDVYATSQSLLRRFTEEPHQELRHAG